MDEIDELLRLYPDLVDTGEPQPRDAVGAAEMQLNVTFPEDFREYLSRWGWLAFGPNEYFGLGTQLNDVVRHNVNLRERGLSPDLLAVASHEGDEFVCIDMAQPAGPVVIWDPGTRTVVRPRATGFAEYLQTDNAEFAEEL